jgi:hypothetical protein
MLLQKICQTVFVKVKSGDQLIPPRPPFPLRPESLQLQAVYTTEYATKKIYILIGNTVVGVLRESNGCAGSACFSFCYKTPLFADKSIG